MPDIAYRKIPPKVATYVTLANEAIKRSDFITAANCYIQARHELILDGYPCEALITNLGHLHKAALNTATGRH